MESDGYSGDDEYSQSIGSENDSFYGDSPFQDDVQYNTVGLEMIDPEEYRKRKRSGDSIHTDGPPNKWRVLVTCGDKKRKKMAKVTGPYKSYMLKACPSPSEAQSDEESSPSSENSTASDDLPGPSGLRGSALKDGDTYVIVPKGYDKEPSRKYKDGSFLLTAPATVVTVGRNKEILTTNINVEENEHKAELESKLMLATALCMPKLLALDDCARESSRFIPEESSLDKLEHVRKQSTDLDINDSREQVGEKTPHSAKSAGNSSSKGDQLREDNPASVASSIVEGANERAAAAAMSPTPIRVRDIPIPDISWADCVELSLLMCYKEDIGLKERSQSLFRRHPYLNPRMRAILYEWLLEVCEVYKLRRATYYLAIDYVDRYLSRVNVVPKHQLQLLGITSLFIAAKMEEIYPPKLTELAYVTDGACTDADMLAKEMEILTKLRWDVNPMTVTHWMSLFLQICSGNPHIRDREFDRKILVDDFIFPQYSPYTFMRASQIVDLCSLDDGMLRFNYSIIAASVIYFMYNRETALYVSGYTWDKICDCVLWMRPFVLVVNRSLVTRPIIYPKDYPRGGSGLRTLNPNIVLEEGHTLQNHVVDLSMLEEVYKLIREMEEVKQSMESNKTAGYSVNETSECENDADERDQADYRHESDTESVHINGSHQHPSQEQELEDSNVTELQNTESEVSIISVGNNCNYALENYPDAWYQPSTSHSSQQIHDEKLKKDGSDYPGDLVLMQMDLLTDSLSTASENSSGEKKEDDIYKPGPSGLSSSTRTNYGIRPRNYHSGSSTSLDDDTASNGTAHSHETTDSNSENTDTSRKNSPF